MLVPGPCEQKHLPKEEEEKIWSLDLQVQTQSRQIDRHTLMISCKSISAAAITPGSGSLRDERNSSCRWETLDGEMSWKWCIASKAFLRTSSLCMRQWPYITKDHTSNTSYHHRSQYWSLLITYLGCFIFSLTSGRRAGIISAPINLQMIINAIDTSSMLELLRS